MSWSFGAATGMATRFLAICCHLEAHTHRVKRRDANARHILSALHLQPPPSPRGLTQTVFSSFFPSASSPLRGRSRSRALSPRPFADARSATGSPLPCDADSFAQLPVPGTAGAACEAHSSRVRSHRHSRGHSMPSPGVAAASRSPRTNAASGHMTPLRSSVESTGSLRDGRWPPRPASAQPAELARRSASMPGGVAAFVESAQNRNAFRPRQRPPVYIESLQQWDPAWARGGGGGCGDRGSEGGCEGVLGVDRALQDERRNMWDGFVGGLDEHSDSAALAQERPRGMSNKELTPVSEGQEALSSGASGGGASASGGTGNRAHGATSARPRTPPTMATVAAAAAAAGVSTSQSLGQLGSLNAWNTPARSSARRQCGSSCGWRGGAGAQAASTASFDFARDSRGCASGRLEAPTPRLLGRAARGSSSGRHSTTPPPQLQQVRGVALDRVTPPALAHTMKDAPWSKLPDLTPCGGAVAGPVCEGAEGRYPSTPGSECSSMHMGSRAPSERALEASPQGHKLISGELSVTAYPVAADVPPSAPPLSCSASLSATDSDAGARAYLACLARMEAASAAGPAVAAGDSAQPREAVSPSRPRHVYSRAAESTAPPEQRRLRAQPADAQQCGREGATRRAASRVKAALAASADTGFVPIVDASLCWGCAPQSSVRTTPSKAPALRRCMEPMLVLSCHMVLLAFVLALRALFWCS